MTIRFGQKLRKLREMRGMSQKQLATRLGYKGTGYFSDVESGAFIPAEDKLKRIAAALEVPFSLIQELLLESKLEDMGVEEPTLISLFKDYPHLTERDKRAIIRTYLQVKAAKKNTRWTK